MCIYNNHIFSPLTRNMWNTGGLTKKHTEKPLKIADNKFSHHSKL